MKPSILLAVLAAGIATAVHAQGAGSQIQTLVVTQRSEYGRALPAPSADRSTAIVTYDGGYIEAGDPIAGERAPAPDQVAQALQSSLTKRGFALATDADAPAAVVTYHWGVIRPERFNRLIGQRDPNLMARLSLVSPSRTAEEVMDEIVLRRLSHVRTPMRIHWTDALNYARDPRYFIIATAYDYAALQRGEIVPLWRVRLSAATNSGSMDETIVALAGKLGDYVGQDLQRITSDEVSVQPRPGAESVSARPARGSVGLDRNALEGILRKEHDQFAGTALPDWEKENWVRRPSAAASTR